MNQGEWVSLQSLVFLYEQVSITIHRNDEWRKISV